MNSRIVLAVLVLMALPLSLSAAVYHFDQVSPAQTVCTGTTATTITTSTLSGSQVTLQPGRVGAGDFEFRMDTSGYGPTAGQRMYTPAFGSCSRIAANATFALWARVSWNGTTPQWQIRLYDVDSSAACGVGTLIAQSAWTNNAGTSGNYASNSIPIGNSAYDIQAGHRIRIELWFRAFANNTDPRVQYGQSGSDSFLTTSESICSVTTVGNGTNPGNASICPAPTGPATMLDAFTLQTNTGTDTITAATVDFADTTNAGVGLVEITNDGGGTLYGSQSNPGDPQSIALSTNITANTTLTQYKVRITPKTHAAMPAPPGASYAVTGVISNIVSSNPKTYNDTSSATITIDNLSTANATWGTITPGNGQVALSWSNPADSDFNQVLILRSTASITDAPSEGVSYVAGNTIGASTVVHVSSGTAFTDTTVTNGTGYWYKIFAKDNCGNYATGAPAGPYTPQTPVGPVTPGTPTATVDHCAQITVSAPFTGDFPSNGSTRFERGTSASGPWGTTTPDCSAVTGSTPRTCQDTGVAGGASYYYRVTFTDPDGVNGTNPQVIGPFTTPACTDTTVQGSSGIASTCDQITVTSPFVGDSNDNGSTRVEYSTSSTGPWTAGCGTLTGSSPRQCLIGSLAANTPYYVLVTWTDPDGVNNTPPACGTNCEKLGPITTKTTCGTDTAAPTLLVVSPAESAIIGGLEKVKVRVYDKVALASTNPVRWSVDGGAFSTIVSVNSNYNCGSKCFVYEIDLDTTALSNNFHYIAVEATDAAGNIARVTRAFQVNNSGSLPAGSGKLLRRTFGSQLCMDCHSLPTHSSQATGTQYGNWALDCITCHAPHNSSNIFLLRNLLRTPNSGKTTIVFEQDDKPGGTNPERSYLGVKNAGNTGPYTDGICEACHTKTLYHRNTSTADHSHNASVRCLKCHGHAVGFAPGGGDCRGCHGTTTQGTRRAVDADFSKNSHHVGDGGSFMGGGFSNFDCVVCHAEGTIVQNKTAAACTTDGWETCLDTSEYHRNGVIDLKDADNLVTVYSYDKDSITGAASTWNSGNATWVTETSSHLDPFCLSCHDSDGANASYSGDCVPDGRSQADCRLSPFGDFSAGGTKLISNNYDQVNRTRVVDIKSRVKDNSPNGDGNCGSPPAAGCADRDQVGEQRYDAAPVGPDGIADPPQGIYSRHAIRGQSVSVYKTTATNWNSTTYWNRTNFAWNSTSVMGCADCHTVDGANTTSGNAHGSNSEYLLKNATGGATEGNTATTYVCAQCHNSSWYEPNNHTTNGNNFEDYTAQTGSARVPVGNTGGNIYGFACGNCHGGAMATPVPPGDGVAQFGTIHGTSQKFGMGTNGTGIAGIRYAYRFTNGNSMRYYRPGPSDADPLNWSGSSSSCYTLSSGSTDNFGGCTKHSGGQGMTKPAPGQRPIKY